MRSAKQRIAAAAACVECGREHEYRRMAIGNQWTWAAKDGHPYRTRLFEMTGNSSGPVIEALRRLASQ